MRLDFAFANSDSLFAILTRTSTRLCGATSTRQRQRAYLHHDASKSVHVRVVFVGQLLIACKVERDTHAQKRDHIEKRFARVYTTHKIDAKKSHSFRRAKKRGRKQRIKKEAHFTHPNEDNSNLIDSQFLLEPQLFHFQLRNHKECKFGKCVGQRSHTTAIK